MPTGSALREDGTQLQCERTVAGVSRRRNYPSLHYRTATPAAGRRDSGPNSLQDAATTEVEDQGLTPHLTEEKQEVVDKGAVHQRKLAPLRCISVRGAHMRQNCEQR